VKTRITLVVLAVTLIFGPASFACAGTYRDEANGFSLSAPVLGPVSSGSSQVLTIAGPQSEGFASNCNVQIQHMDGSLKDYEQLSLGQFKQLGWTMLSSSRTEVSGHTAIRWHYTGEMRGLKFEWLSVVTAREGKFYLLTCTSKKSTSKKDMPAFEATISSFAVQ
jgi:hypothetical protein